MKISIFIIVLLFFFVSCRGPLSKPAASDKQTDIQKEVSNTMGMTHIADAKAGKEDIKIEPAAGCITISDLLADKKKYADKTVKIKGKITKVNSAIMGKNWVHVQDGTEYAGLFDLTVTTDLELEPGTIVTIEGNVVLDKDFGYGYKYEVILEGGKVVN